MSRWSVVGGASCCHVFVSGLVAWFALVTWDLDEGGGPLPVDKSLVSILGFTLDSFFSS